ncbi:hypothetical protein [Phyllobacterium myrsinacearum]|uniref:Lectin-like protein BA14k n=1 Tax=Phyllobacterium myrsinacearum TaxID=28101 RepID=A0A839EPF0_9HYPH|nr:hypothetical protein [Phyllobacterium myrsinacearum]MBA8879296.1 hypothetical protein [Phyllobacterium myrsinacearum]
MSVRMLFTSLVALPMIAAATQSYAGEYEYFQDSDGSVYESYSDDRGSQFDTGTAAALGIFGGIAAGAMIANAGSSRHLTVREEPNCYTTWRRVWSDYYSEYHRQRLRVCE